MVTLMDDDDDQKREKEREREREKSERKKRNFEKPKGDDEGKVCLKSKRKPEENEEVKERRSRQTETVKKVKEEFKVHGKAGSNGHKNWLWEQSPEHHRRETAKHT